MKINVNINEEHLQVHKSISLKEKLESKALAILTAETLNKLKISPESLPQRCQILLQQVSESQISLEIEDLDPTSIALIRNKELTEKLTDDYEILKLQQKNAELQLSIDRNKKFIDNLKLELENSRKSLAHQNPNPANIHDHIKQLKQKLASYEDSYEKAKAKYHTLSLPEVILPKALSSQVTTLTELKQEEAVLKQRADDLALVEEAREVFSRLRK
ncbi:uncharacterized protein LOC116774769 isoform X2 [Danaus plexippus]|uniref:uncharacterized protein LOC116774769 isoform X2 n=1 Tax=Danaus plexippus TaxID=13037 RepID=UPI0013C3F199|nr:uncharacterized protein LOC116774769 isoform X2 [Danaus plexippus]